MVRLKKYFYVLRPLLAARWVMKTGQAAPITPELGLAPAVPILNAFIESELDKAPIEVPKKPQSTHVVALLNKLFHGALHESVQRAAAHSSIEGF